MLFNHNRNDKAVLTFPKGICPKVNVIAWLEFELAYCVYAVQRFYHYTTSKPQNKWCINNSKHKLETSSGYVGSTEISLKQEIEKNVN